MLKPINDANLKLIEGCQNKVNEVFKVSQWMFSS